MRRLRRVSISAFACLGIMLAGCSLENGINIDKSNNQLPETQEIMLLESLDATNLHYIEPYDENTVYIVASKKSEEIPGREMVYAVCSLDTGETNVLYREIISKDGAESVDIYASSDNEIKLFTGQQLLTLNGQDVVDIQNIIDDEQGVSMNLEKGAMAYISQLPPSVFYKSVNDNNEIEIAKSEELEIDGETVTLYPYIVRLKESGDKLLYGTAIETAGLYQTICICSTDGTLLAETEQLDINSDYLDILWCGDDFITIETTDSYTLSPTGFATILTRYNEKAEKIDSNSPINFINQVELMYKINGHNQDDIKKYIDGIITSNNKLSQYFIDKSGNIIIPNYRFDKGIESAFFDLETSIQANINNIEV